MTALDTHRVESGRLYWVAPRTPGQTNVLALAMPYEGGRLSWVIACSNDPRLAGHLDPILPPNSVGLPYAVTILSHVGAWVETDRLTPTSGLLDPWHVVEVEGARAGVAPVTLAVGRLLRSPDLDPRWPLIESTVREWYRVVES